MNAKDSRRNINRAIHREYTDSQGNIRTEYKDTQGNIYTEYRDSLGNFHSDKNGSIHSKLVDAHIQDVRVERADKNISKGLLIGVIVTTVVGLTAAVIYFFNDLNNPQPVPVVNIPAEKSDSNANPTPPPVKVVEREVVKFVPVEIPVQTSLPVPAKVPEANNNPSTINNITVKPSESNPAQKETSSNIPAVKPAQNPTASTPKPLVVPSKTDGDLKNEILNKFQNNLSNNQLKVDVKNGAVIVSGNVETQEQMQQIQPLLKSIEGIKKLDVKATVANGVTN